MKNNWRWDLETEPKRRVGLGWVGLSWFGLQEEDKAAIQNHSFHVSWWQEASLYYYAIVGAAIILQVP